MESKPWRRCHKQKERGRGGKMRDCDENEGALSRCLNSVGKT